MSEADWEMFDALFKTMHSQGVRIEELLTRVTELERRLREREADIQTERPVLRLKAVNTWE